MKVDRVACPWLIKEFIDPEADFVFVPANEVEKRSRESGPRALTVLGPVDLS